MFYPVESLKRGGRFYLCWVADSWPLRFAAITQRQLNSQDICKLCDDLMEVVTNESGRPSCRFSLRLSSQLMRGLVRLYEKKVTLFLGELCMLNAQVFKHTNKKFVIPGTPVLRPVHLPAPQEPLPRPELAPEPQEQQVEDLIQNSGNVVANIQDITLKEATIPEIQLPPNDGFGEENPDQALQQLLQNRTVEDMLEIDANLQFLQPEDIANRTVEQMLHQVDISNVQHSGLDLEMDKSNKSGDKSRLAQDRQMERISEIDMPLLRKSTAPEQMEVEFGKDIPEIPEIIPPEPPVIPDPEIPAVPQIVVTEPEAPVAPEPAPVPEIEVPRQPEPLVDIELEELEQDQVTRRRRARRHLIIDKRTKLSAAYLRARIDQVNVEQRCEDFSEDIADIRVPFEILSKRPAHAGHRQQSRVSSTLLTMFQRRLVTEPRPFDREIQEAEPDRVRRASRSLPKVPEEPEQLPEVAQEVLQPNVEPPTVETAAVDQTRQSDVVPNVSDLMNVTEMIPNLEQTLNIPHIDPEQETVQQIGTAIQLGDEQDPDPSIIPQTPAEGQQPLDISEMPTQVLQRLSQVSSKRPSQQDRPAKRSCPSGVYSFRNSSTPAMEKENIPPPNVNQPLQPLNELLPPLNESLPPLNQSLPPVNQSQQPLNQSQQPLDQLQQPLNQSQPPLTQSKDVSTLLQEAGIAEVQPLRTQADQEMQPQARASETSETPLGSLDRTKVSLGDASVRTTDTQRFIRNHWGIEYTMVKILDCMRRGNVPITVHELIRHGPAPSGLRGVMAARCFNSILKLKQHQFIVIAKDPGSNEILNITLGSRFDGIDL